MKTFFIACSALIKKGTDEDESTFTRRFHDHIFTLAAKLSVCFHQRLALVVQQLVLDEPVLSCVLP